MRLSIYALIAGGLVYCADWAFSGLHPRFDSVHVERFLAVHEKFNKVSYEHTNPRDERCVYALFPHAGMHPCWYAQRHTSEFIDVD